MYIHVHLAELQAIRQIYWIRLVKLESDKYDLERGCKIKKMEVKRLNHTNTQTYAQIYIA